MTPFVRAALVGLGQAPAEPTGTPVDTLVPGDDAWSVLLRAGALDVYRQAGARHADRELPEPPQDEPRPPAPASVSGLIQNVLNRSPALIGTLVQALQDKGYCLPQSALQAALDSRDLALVPLFGPREQWLAQQNPRWAWVVEDAGAPDWDEGTPTERLALLRTLRAQDPDAARELLEDGFAGEKADFRASALALFLAAPRPQDERFLQACLSDRSGKVREVATRVLCALPGSGLVQRMTQRADPLLQVTRDTPGVLQRLRGRKQVLRIDFELPTAFGADWAQDGMNPRGKKSSWLLHILQCVPPRHWCQRLEISHAQLLESLVEAEEAVAIQTAGMWAGDLDMVPLCEDRLHMLNVDQDALRQLLRDRFRPALIERLDGPWPQDIARAWLGQVRQDVNTPTWWPDTLDAAALALPPSVLRDAHLGDVGWSPSVRRKVETYNDHLHQRLRILEIP